MHRMFLMHSKSYDPKKNHPTGWMMCEKWDGVRCLWDGGISTGLPCSDVPYANVEKDKRFKEAPIATGLWTRYGHSIQAPPSFISKLPPFPLDGELWMGYKKWQELSKVVRCITPLETEWERIQYNVFDTPPFEHLFQDGFIYEPGHFEKVISNCVDWAFDRSSVPDHPFLDPTVRFEQRYLRLKAEFTRLNIQHPFLLTEYHLLSRHPETCRDEIERFLGDVLDRDGEGVILRQTQSFWEPKRTQWLLKYKPYRDTEAEVIGYKWGRETDKGSKFLGMMGAMTLKLKSGKVFEMSGFKDEERVLTFLNGGHNGIATVGVRCAGMEVDSDVHNPMFPRGTIVTIKYRELSNDGIPKEARYWRKRGDS